MLCIELSYVRSYTFTYVAMLSHTVYTVIQNFKGTKLLQLDHHVSIHGKTFTFASKQHPLAPKHFEICGKTFVVQGKTTKSAKVLLLKGFVIYGT